MLLKKPKEDPNSKDEAVVQPLLEAEKIPSCVICVGSTGSGKSATISKFTRLPIKSNAGKWQRHQHI
jgi:signal recognition particle GTPase